VIALSFSPGADRSQGDIDAQVKAIMSRYKALPGHIAKKHLGAAMRRTLADGVPVLRRFTPPLGTRRGRLPKGEKRSTGAMRRSVTTKAKVILARNVAYGVLGYKYGDQSHKAIWMEKGTKAIKPQRMVAKAMSAYGPISSSRLAAELAAALEKASKELEAGLNPTRKYEK
jgi:hypothetical protein